MRKLSLLTIICIFFVSCQLPTANYLRDKAFPENNVTKIALSPILFPTYVVACVVDIALVNPARGTLNVPKVSENIWKWQNKNPWIGYVALMPVKIVGIPLAAVGTTAVSEQFIYNDK